MSPAQLYYSQHLISEYGPIFSPMTAYNLDKQYMKLALKEAITAFDKDEVPVGCVVVHKGRIVGKAHNQVETLKDPTAHAEMIALTQACTTLKSKWLKDATAYVTIEPCSMCAGALVLARINRLVFGAKDPKTGACGSVFNIPESKKLNHKFKIKSGVMQQDCAALLSEFFKKKRKSKN